MVIVPRPHLDEVARRFDLLSDPTRLRVLSAVHEHGEATVTDIARTAETSVANTSQHLQRLARGGVLGRRRDGQTIRYRIVDETVERLCAIVCDDIARRHHPEAWPPAGAWPRPDGESPGRERDAAGHHDPVKEASHA